MNGHILKSQSWKTLHPYCHVSAKGQMTALRSYSATCTFLRTTHKMGWRQSLFQEPSVNTCLFYTCYCHLNGPLWGKNAPLCHLCHYPHGPEYPSFTSAVPLTFSWQHLTKLPDPKQTSALPRNHSKFFPLHFHMISCCICTLIIIICMYLSPQSYSKLLQAKECVSGLSHST